MFIFKFPVIFSNLDNREQLANWRSNEADKHAIHVQNVLSDMREPN